MRNTYRPVPFIRLLLPLILGILIGQYVALPQMVYVGLFFMGIMGILAFRKSGRMQPVFSLALCLSLLSLGVFLVDFHDQTDAQEDLSHYVQKKPQQWLGTIVSMPVSKRQMTCEVELRALYQDSAWIPVRGRIQARFDKDTTSLGFRYGDVVLARSYLNEVEAPQNPSAFDYRRYLAHQGIHHQTFVKADVARVLASGEGNVLVRWSLGLRRRAVEALRTHLSTPNELAVGSALILGYKDEMTEEVKEGYARTGATHVLAVSGLHVGILYMVVAFLFQRLGRLGRGMKFVELCLTLLLIWGFVLVTGAPPSVQRAATMFSFVAVGGVFSRHRNIYNTLAASSFFLLVANPMMLFQPGFQLSYLAVLGIVFFQPIIYKSWYVGHRIGDGVWQLMSVSLAAQLVTLPVSLYYFHQFPTYFLLSGLVVIPAASVIMVSGLALVLLAQVPVLSSLLGQLLYGVIWVVNAAIFIIGELPFSLLENIYVSFEGMLLGYLAIGSLMLWLSWKDNRFFMAALGLLALAMALHAGQRIGAQHKQEYVFFHSRHTLVDYYANGQRSTYHHPDLNTKNQAYAAQAHRLAIGYLKENGNVPQEWEGGFVQLGRQRLLIINDSYKYPKSAHSIPVDGIIIQDNPYLEMDAILQDFEPRFFLADGSNYDSRVALWRQELEKLEADIPMHYTKEGAWIERGD